MSHESKDALIDLQVRHETLLEHSECIIGEVDAAGQFLYVSPSVERVLGVKPEKLLGKLAFEHIHTDDREPVSAMLAHLFADGPGGSTAAKMHWPDANGNFRLMDVNAVCYQRSDGAPAMAFLASDITTQNELLGQLRETQTRFEAASNLSDTIIAIIDIEGKYSYLNAPAALILGYSLQELVGSYSYEHVHPKDVGVVSDAVALALKNPDSQKSIRYRYQHKNGNWVLLETRLSSFVDASGDRLILGNARDITARESAAKRLRDSEARLERALDTTGLGIWEWDIASGQVSVDAAFERVLGFSPGEMSFNEGWMDSYIHPKDLARALENIGQRLKPNALAYETTVRYKHKNQEWGWVALRSTVTERDTSGRALRGIGTIKDINAEVLAQEEAKQANRRVALLLDSTEEGICGIDQVGAITMMNPAAERMLGQPKGELVGSDFTRRVMHGFVAGESDRVLVRSTLREGERLERVMARFQRADESIFPVEFSMSPIMEDGNLRGAVLVFRDETRSRRLEDRLQYQTVHDAVTGLTNRQGFKDAVEILLGDAQTHGTTHALFYLDLDQFRVVNAISGHGAGDELLRQLALHLGQKMPGYHTLARIGGDEFGVLMQNCPLQDATQVAQRLRQQISEFTFVQGQRVFRCSVCIGVVEICAQSLDSAEILAAADAACFVAKEAGRNRIHVAMASDPIISQRRDEMAWAARTREALDNNRLTLFSQPIVPIKKNSGLPGHSEILLRMLGSNDEIMAPGLFLPAAERHFLMPSVDRWVLKSLLTQLPGQASQTQRYSINLSGGTIGEEGLLGEITDLIDTSGVSPERLCFEITETAAVAHLPTALKLMSGLRERGCEFALDDFGTGMSSLTYLRQLPVDYVKIDGKFVRGILEDTVDQAIVQAVFDVTKMLGIRTVAEHVESEETLTRLAEIGIDYAQGFFTGRPAPIAAAA